LDPHRLAELRSIALHRAIAVAILRDPLLIEEARRRLRQRVGRARGERSYAGAWAQWLELPPGELARRIVCDDDDGRAMRQSTPFTFVVTPQQRWAIWARVRDQSGREP
jgi:hypothetical protein